MAIKIGSLLIRLAVEHGILQEGLAQSERDVAKTTKAIERRGREIADFGQKMSLAISLPIVGLAGASIKAAKESADAIGQVNAALASMGDQAGRTSDQLAALAESQMGQSLFDDDQILREVTANLLTFGQVSGEQFDRAQQAALDLATRMNGDLKGATIQIGKALNDPVKGLTALGKAGIQFTADQKAMIESMVEAGNVAGAQQIILGELEKQFGGAAKAAREADPGAALAQSFATFQEEIGAKLLPLLPAITSAITGVLDAFGSMPDGVQQAIIVIGGLAAAIGPVAVVIGSLVSAASGTLAVFSGLGATFGAVAAAAAPFLAVAAAIGAAAYLIYDNWDSIAPVLEAVWDKIQTVLGPPIEKLIASATELLTALWEGPLGEAIRTVVGVLGDLGAAYADVMGDRLTRVFNAALAYIGMVFDQIGNIFDLFTALLRGDFAGAWQAVKNIVSTAVNGFLKVIEAAFPGAIKYVRDLYLGVKQWLHDKLGAIFDWVGKKVQAVTGFFFDMYDAVVGNSYVPDMVDGIKAEFDRLQAVMVDPAKKATASVTEDTRKMAQDVMGLLDRLFPEMARARKLAEELALIDGAGLSETARSRARLRLLGEANGGGRATVSFDTAPEEPLVAAGKVREATEEIKDSMGGLAKESEIQTVRIAQTFQQMVESILSKSRQLVDGLKSGDFASILEGAFGVFSALGNSGVLGSGIRNFLNGVPGNANGTAYHPGGLMKVGERGPELLMAPRGARVVPNHELRAAGQTARAHVTVGIDPRNGNITAFVNGQIAATAPMVANLGASQAQRIAARSGQRRVR